MPFFQHRFEKPADYLHHRPPYLMVDEILAIETEAVRTRKRVCGDEFFFPGHFPGAPVFPGAMMQELCTQSGGILIAANYNPMATFDPHEPNANEYALGVLVRVRQAKFKSFVRPGDELLARVRLNMQANSLFDFSGEIQRDEQTIMRIEFQLMNVESSLLTEPS